MIKTSTGRQPALSHESANPNDLPKPTLSGRSPAKFRLLPLTLVMLTLMLGVRLHDLYQDGSKLRDMMFPSAVAEETAGNKTMPETAPAADAKPEDKKMEMASADTKAAEAGAPEGAKEGEKAAGTEGATSPDVSLAKLSDQPGLASSERKHDYSNIELDILQSLAQRRDQLDERSKEVDLKEKLLEATEMRINDKVSEIKSLKVEVQKLLDEYNTKEKAKVQGLVKIYENMKPKDAANIFNELEMPILLEVVDQMSARKVAPVLANMDPMRAKDVTRELAEYRKLREIPKNISQK